jgi:hypothetical protein
MNLREEIEKFLIPTGEAHHSKSVITQYHIDEIIALAESYAKEKAWGIWKYLDKQVCRYGGFPFIEEKSRELFEAEYAAQIEELKKEEPK